MTPEETEEQTIKRVGKQMFGVLLTPQMVEVVRPIYRKFLLDNERIKSERQPTGDQKPECAA